MTTITDLLKDVLELPRTDRGYIAQKLIESLDDEKDDELSPEWKAELDRRVQSIEDGTAKLIPHDEVMTKVREQLANLPHSTKNSMTLDWLDEAKQDLLEASIYYQLQ